MPLALQGAPNPTPDFRTSPTPFILLSVAGFVIGVLGHITQLRLLVIVGIGMIFLGTFVLPVLLYVLHV
ncbi:MAG TPA: hypothetical protein VHE14_02845 [Solirubrobacteraceae bacterium]|nr:hypothetical protein [Solirubrobacteraceae bacterium]